MVAQTYALFGRPSCESRSDISYVQIQNTLVVEMLPTGAHQCRQAEVTRHGVQYESCHRGEILVTNLTLFHEIHSFHWTVSDLLAVVNMLKTIRADLSAVQADEVQSPPGVHVLFNLDKSFHTLQEIKIGNPGQQA